MSRSIRRFGAAVVAAGLIVSGLAACSSDKGSSESNEVTIKIGTTDASKSAWTTFKAEAKKAGINLDVVSFGDYNTPNTALSEKQIDVNLFQHIKFLANYNVKANDTLTPIGATEIVPLALYYKDHKDLSELPEGAEVAVPNDSTNQGRALNLLAANNLIKLKNDNLLNPSPADIDEAASKVKVTPVDAAQTATAWGEGTPAVVNNTFLLRAGIDPSTRLVADDPNSPSAQPYINVLVTRQDNKDDANIKKLVAVWHSEAVQKANAADSGNTSVSVDLPADQLEQILKDTEEKTRAESNS